MNDMPDLHEKKKREKERETELLRLHEKPKAKR